MFPAINFKLDDSGRVSDALRLPTPEALRIRLIEAPELRAPFIRAVTNYQGERVPALYELGGREGERLETLATPARRRLVDLAKVIVGLAARGEVACETVGATEYEELSKLKLPEAGVVAELRQNRISRSSFESVLNCIPYVRIDAARARHEQHIEGSITDKTVAAELARSVLEAGGLRFDRFVERHQFGATGFYSTRLDFASELGMTTVPTPINHDDQYCRMIVNNMLGFTNMRIAEGQARGRNFREKPLVFAEIGGGRGRFKTEFLDAYDASISRGLQVPLDYVSVDINHFQRLAQTIPGSRVQIGEATATGLPDKSVDILFSEEVPDCFPHRWLRWDQGAGKFSAEAFVVQDGNHLGVEWREPERGDDLGEVEKYLRGSSYSSPYYRYSSMDRAFWAEAKRVLKPGGQHVVLDYTLLGIERTRGDMLGMTSVAINLPYNDITRGVDMGWMEKIAVELGFSCRRVVLAGRPHQPGEERAIIAGRSPE